MGDKLRDEDDALFDDEEGTATASRFYEAEFPEVEDLVMVQVTRVLETNAYVKLLEYGNKEGMILLAEVSAKRIRSMLKEIRVGQFCVCLVLRTEEGRGYIDLSRRRVQPDERAKFLERYARSKQVHSTLRQLCAEHKVGMPDLCEKISWPLYANPKFKHALDAFKAYVNDGDDSIFRSLLPGKDEQPLLESLLAIIKRRLTPQAMKLKAKVEVKCYEIEGINAVKKALLAGQDVPAEELGGPDSIQSLTIKVVAPPEYDLVATSMGKEAGVKLIESALTRIENSIKESGGMFSVKDKPIVIGEDDDDEENAGDSDDESIASEESDVEGMGGAEIDASAFDRK